MIKQEHIKQVSSEKVIKFVSELYKEILETINIQTGYLNDTEKVASIVILNKTISDDCEQIIGTESTERICSYILKHKENIDNEREDDNKEEWRIRSI